MTLCSDKKALRERALLLRAALTERERLAASAALCEAITDLPAFAACELLLAFYPVRGEVDLRALYERALLAGKRVAFPRCEGREMRFYVCEPHALVPGRFGIPTPPREAPQALPGERTLCLLPALAADKDGGRLGYGGGFYDRFLANFKGVAILPLYHALLVPHVPQEPTDIRPHLVLSEKGVIFRA